ncbi:glycosyltransferase family 2 protein [Vararia minispora EC-137]|uniref:Glycosyltransferase family 2 protein n=1 Tax=Vararia minispora EC-137 TaxID=1314806 RepID=A0ACB8QDJ7_9AGAM|nr:glycosyltransferase family 2 protein [Vararia minispora EC-137]
MANVRYNQADIPIPTTHPGPRPGPSATIRRAKTLTRPERGVAPPPLIAPQQSLITSAAVAAPDASPSSLTPWVLFSWLVTFWAPGIVLSSLGMRDKQVQQAWREKIALVFIICCLCAVIGFATVGLQQVFCPQQSVVDPSRFLSLGATPGTLSVQGTVFNISNSKPTSSVNFFTLASEMSGQDITYLFTRSASDFPACHGLSYKIATDAPCTSSASCPLGNLNSSSAFSTLGLVNTNRPIGYGWDQVGSIGNYIVIDGNVLNLNPYISAHNQTAVANDLVDAALRSVLAQDSKGGRDATRLFVNNAALKSAIPCLKQRYVAGHIDKITPGCFVSNLVLYAGLIVILGLVLVRFVMAIIFSWFLSGRLAGNPDSRSLDRHAISPAVLPEGANVSVDNRLGTAPWAGGGRKLQKPGAKGSSMGDQSLANGNSAMSPVLNLARIGAELFTICLVTCYSEGEDSLRTTLDSISQTTFSDERKLLFVVADGMITGAGEKRSTPDICVSLLEADPRFGDPVPMSYIAVGTGAKAENRAMVYAGHYTVAGRRTPTIIIVKCGTEREAATDKKPGNRGKRDSQLILMNFFSHVTYNDRMTPLDFDLFRKIHILMGVTPDFFEVCLMVDADTKVFPGSLKALVNCMHHDPMIMGVCGETRIANKRQSWVTTIQVFEYFISHHMAKAFESVFGGVTCLPGCFSMFRIKARKSSGDDWVPLIVKPEIVKEYSQSVVTTLHEKNLLLLGEDRFLTTLLLRTFPNRKMIFLPQARCRTVVPDTFNVLLSQRRRWINSTIHNLMELVLVRNLCGTFCFSMQFVVFMDLLGTVVLPIAIVLTYILIVKSALNPPHSFSEAIPLVLLIAVLGLPSILIMLTTRKVEYVAWMFIYLLALPIWNMILPIYAFWHFDDFSWGETRKVEGEGKDTGHGEGKGISAAASVPLRRWEDWERSRLRKIKREEKRRREFARAHPGGFVAGDEYLSVRSAVESTYDGSDAASVTSSEDHWGANIGGYNENNMQYPPPPVGLHSLPSGGKLIGEDDLEAMLESGWDEGPSPSASTDALHAAPSHLVPPTPGAPTHAPRYQLSDGGDGGGGGYAPLGRGPRPPSPSTPGAKTSALEDGSWKGHMKKRSGERRDYGPLGPLDPGAKF